MKWKSIVVLLLVAAALGIILGWTAHEPPPPAAPLPPEVKIVETVKTIEKVVPGKPQVVERLKVVTEEKPVYVDVIREVVKEIDSGRIPPARVAFDLDKLKGTVSNGKLAYGWKGLGRCEVQLASGWKALAEAPLSLEDTVAVTTEGPPAAVERRRVDLDYGMGQDGRAFAVGYSQRLTKHLWVGGAYWQGADESALAARLSWSW